MRRWIPGALIAAAFALSAAVWTRLPERVPIHWNARGEIDGWGGRVEGALLLPAVALGLWALLNVLPRIDPRVGSYPKFRETYDLVVAAVVALLVAIHAVVLATALGHHVDVGRVIPVMLGLMLVTIGNVLPRTRPNWWMGVRTPWTLSNDRVWERTHRVGGRLMVAAGVATMLSALLPPRFAFVVLITAVTAAALGSVVYSYVAWREETSR